MDDVILGMGNIRDVKSKLSDKQYNFLVKMKKIMTEALEEKIIDSNTYLDYSKFEADFILREKENS